MQNKTASTGEYSDTKSYISKKLELTMNTEQIKLVNMWDEKEGFDFLGLHHRKYPKHDERREKAACDGTYSEPESHEENAGED